MHGTKLLNIEFSCGGIRLVLKKFQILDYLGFLMFCLGLVNRIQTKLWNPAKERRASETADTRENWTTFPLRTCGWVKWVGSVQERTVLRDSNVEHLQVQALGAQGLFSPCSPSSSFPWTQFLLDPCPVLPQCSVAAPLPAPFCTHPHVSPLLHVHLWFTLILLGLLVWHALVAIFIQQLKQYFQFWNCMCFRNSWG